MTNIELHSGTIPDTQIIEKLLERVSELDNEVLEDWLQCFGSTRGRKQLSAQEEIRTSLAPENQQNPQMNFIMRLLSAEPDGYATKYGSNPTDFKKRGDLAVLFMQAMWEDSEWNRFTEAMINDGTKKLLEKVSVMNRELYQNWCDSQTSKEIGVKQKIKQFVEQGQRQGVTINFLTELTTFEPGSEDKSRVDLATNFVQAMKKNLYWPIFWKPAILFTAKYEPVISAALYKSPRATYNTNHYNPLHQAAFLGEFEEAQKLSGQGNKPVLIDEQGRTPLHYAAMAICPSPKMVGLLWGMRRMVPSVINKHSDKDNGWNTALHVAAGNVNVTQEFIDMFKEADPTSLNYDRQTAFHIAAKSRNSKAILYMLRTFAPTQNRWDVDYVDELEGVDSPKKERRQGLFNRTVCCRKASVENVSLAESLITGTQESRSKYLRKCRLSTRPKKVQMSNRLIDICARNGNVEAVEQLIKNGADISLGVLHEIVLESVKHPDKFVQLKAVYQVIVDNAVTWRCLEGKAIRPTPLKASKVYQKMLKETVIWLLSRQLELYEKKNVLEYAICLGASEMFHVLVNTNGVLRERNKKGMVSFDVTNFTRATTVVRASQPTAERDFKRPDLPTMPYVTQLLASFNQWKHTNILSTQPLKELTQVYMVLVRRMLFVASLIQLMFMIIFSVHYSPSISSLTEMFHVSVDHSHGNSGSTEMYTNVTNSSERMPDHADNFDITSTLNSDSPHKRSLPSWRWLIWPVVFLIGNVAWSSFCFVYSKAYKSVYGIRNWLLDSIPLKLFCCFVFGWFHTYRYSEAYERYVEVTATVQLFGWLTCISFFGAVSKEINVSILLVKEILKKDIPSFIVFFALTVVGFSFAMHALRLSACELHEHMTARDTFYGILSSAFGMGDFYNDVVIKDSKCPTGTRTQHLFEIVYLGYIAITLIILLNLLIAMMNHRYDLDKDNAINVWRYENLSAMRVLESDEKFLNILNLCKKKKESVNQSVRKCGSGCSRCMLLISAIFCCFCREYRNIREGKNKDDDNEGVEDTQRRYYLTVKKRGDK